MCGCGVSGNCFGGCACGCKHNTRNNEVVESTVTDITDIKVIDEAEYTFVATDLVHELDLRGNSKFGNRTVWFTREDGEVSFVFFHKRDSD